MYGWRRKELRERREEGESEQGRKRESEGIGGGGRMKGMKGGYDVGRL